MLSVSTADFERRGARFVAGLLRGGESLLREVMGAAAVEAASVTPPGSASVQGAGALERGKQAVTSNELSVGAPVRGAKSASSTAAVVRSHRSGGRTRRRARRIVVSRADFESYLADKHRAVGYTAGGWSAGADLLGAGLPGWMEDVSGPGSVSIQSSGDLVEVRVTNEVPWISELSGMAERLATVMTHAEEGLTARLSEMLDQQANAAGF